MADIATLSLVQQATSASPEPRAGGRRLPADGKPLDVFHSVKVRLAALPNFLCLRSLDDRTFQVAQDYGADISGHDEV
jgi:hypothetical protein